MRVSPSAPGIPPAGHPIYYLPCMAYTMPIIFNKKVRSADPLELSQLVVDLRSRYLAYWRQFSGYDPQDANSNQSTYHHSCALPAKPAH
eukprot:624079-Pelagomonas_calceolata.AAC.1